MNLAPDELKRFYGIWWPLLTFVNQERRLVADWPENPVRSGVALETALPVRDALWEDDDLLDRFIGDNPARLSADDLTLARSWKQRVSGGFAVLRHLKKHTIFLGEESDAYAVLGLLSPLEEMLPDLPMYAHATLLPFGDRIIYDGILTSPPVFLGSGIRAELNDRYKGITESVGLITSLPDSVETRRPRILEGNVKLLKAFRAFLAGSGLSEKMVGQHAANLALLGEEMAAQESPRALWSLTLSIARRYSLTHPDAATSVKRFARFLFDTGRGDHGTVWDLQEIRRR